jgi:hypothetical protein
LLNFDVFIREQMQTAYGQEDWWSRERRTHPVHSAASSLLFTGLSASIVR